MNATDYDKSKFDSDKYGHLTVKPKGTTRYKGYTIDADGIGRKRVWDFNLNFIGDFPDISSAKEHIDTLK